MQLNLLIKTGMIATALSLCLTVGACGRRGNPVPLDPTATSGQNGATADGKPPLPHGIDDNSLRAGAPKTKSIFDSIL